MSRRPAPYWKASHAAWYCTIAGVKHRLGTDQRDAEHEFHRLMASAGNSPAPQSLRVNQLVDLFLDAVRSEIKPVTWDNYQIWLRRWCDHSGQLRGADVRPLHVAGWLRAHPSWGRNTRSFATTVLKLWSRWCRRQSYLAVDPLIDLRNTSITRRVKPAPGALESVQAAILAPETTDFLAVALATGARPGELRTLSASEIDWETCRATVNGKTGKRVISFPRSILTILRRLAARWPEGPILRNTLGQPWTRGALGTQMRRARKRAGVEHVVPYSARGHFGTEAIRRGVDLLLVSRLLGHSTPTTTAKFYLEPDQSMLTAAVERATKKRCRT
jgi:integrase